MRDEKPDFLGKNPIEIETIVAPACPNPRLLKFTIHEYTGFEIYTYTSDLALLSPREIFDDRHWPRSPEGGFRYHHAITRRDGIKDGDRVVWKDTPHSYFWGLGLILMKDGDASLVRKESGPIEGVLQFDTDDRHCWVCTFSYNARAIARIKISP